MTRKLFGTDGIRGLANKFPMNSEVALKVGMAAGRVFTNGDHTHRVVIGKDTRLSGYMIESALVSGFTSVGMDVFQFGPLPTPAVAMLTRSLRADLGVMISASHNQYHDNGIKLFGPDGQKLSDEREREIEALMENGLEEGLAEPAKIGRARRIEDAQARYIEFVKRTFPKHLRLEGLRIVVDCAHGAAYRVAPAVLWELGADVFAIGVEPNGININQEVGSTAPGAMIEKVKETRADFGIALDGDADRVVMCDEKGFIIDGDQVLALIARSWARSGELQGGGVVGTVMSNIGLERYLATQNLKLVRSPVGDRYVIEKMRRRLQPRRRAIRAHHPQRLRDDRRRPDRRAAGAGRVGGRTPARQRGRAYLRARAAVSGKCPAAPGRAAQRREGDFAHKGLRRAPERQRPPLGAQIGHRARHPHHGRGRRREAGSPDGARDRASHPRSQRLIFPSPLVGEGRVRGHIAPTDTLR